MAFQETSRSPLNNSKFKQLYSFPKANRFTSQGFISKAPYYDNKVTALNQRATSFGYGNKYTLQNKNPFPPPNNYNKSGLFEANITKRVGYSFSHDKKKGLVQEEVVGSIPGPGKYNFLHDKTDFKRISYSLRGKYEDPLTRNQNPLGPGQYSTIADFNRSGSYFLAKHPGSGCSKIGNSKRFTDIKTLAPGPGKCITEDILDEDVKVTGLNNSGTYFYSTFRTNKAASFAHSPRKHIADPSITPGPGSYQRFSDFPRPLNKR